MFPLGVHFPVFGSLVTLRMFRETLTIYSLIGVLQIATGSGGGDESRSPLDLVIVGRMLFSTFQAFLLVSIVFTVPARLTKQTMDAESRLRHVFRNQCRGQVVADHAR